MKKQLAVLLGCACLIFVACPSKDQVDPNPQPVPPVESVDTLSAEEQKEKIEESMSKFLEEFPAKEYEDLIKLANSFYEYGMKNFDDDFDGTEIEDVWEDELYDEIYSEEENRNGIYEYLLKLSKCTGIITVEGDKATYQKSSELKLIVKDVDGEDWVLNVVPSQWKYDVYLGTFGDSSVTIDLPSKINIYLQVGAKKYAEIDVDYTYNFGEDGIDPNESSISVSTVFRIDDISLSIYNLKYDAKAGEFSLSLGLKRGDKTLFACTTQAEGELRIDDEEIEDFELNSLSFSFNIMDEVQFVGFVDDDEYLFEDIIDGTIEFVGEKSEMRELAAKLNKVISIDVCYNNTNESSAKIVADYMKLEDGDYYAVVPVLEFMDGTSYSFIEFFEEFIEDDVDNWESDIEDLVNDYIEMINDIFFNGEDVLEELRF